jgi:peptide/nickel transport system permease protein
MLPAFVVLVLVLVPTALLPYPPTSAVAPPSLPPSPDHFFGTDGAGMDVFSRTIAAFALDVPLGAMVSVVAVVLSGVVGVTLGYTESNPGVVGYVSRAAIRVVELFQAIPGMVAALVVIATFGLNVPVIVVCFAVILAPEQIRLVRTEVLRVKGAGYIDSARIAGLSSPRVALTRVLPNSIWPLLENWPGLFAVATVVISALGFLGVGFPPPTPEWGAMISSAAAEAAVGRWWTFLFPALALSLTVLAAVALRNGIVRLLPRHIGGITN